MSLPPKSTRFIFQREQFEICNNVKTSLFSLFAVMRTIFFKTTQHKKKKEKEEKNYKHLFSINVKTESIYNGILLSTEQFHGTY